MIDTIECYYETKYLPVFSSEVLKTSPKVSGDKTFYNYKYRNLVIAVIEYHPNKRYKVTIQGSLTKFMHGNNIAMIRRNDLKICISMLSEVLGIDFCLFKITRLDFGTCLPIEFPPHAYLGLFNNFNRMKRIIYFSSNQSLESVRYESSRYSVLFYDKLREMRKNGSLKEIPLIVRSGHLLRYEVRFKPRGLINLFTNLPEVGDLLQYKNFKMLYREWKRIIHSITKKRFIVSNKVRVPTELNHILALRGYHEQLNEDSAEDIINRSLDAGIMNIQQASNSRRYLKRLLAKDATKYTSKHEKELKRKIRLIKYLY